MRILIAMSALAVILFAATPAIAQETPVTPDQKSADTPKPKRNIETSFLGVRTGMTPGEVADFVKNLKPEYVISVTETERKSSDDKKYFIRRPEDTFLIDRVVARMEIEHFAAEKPDCESVIGAQYMLQPSIGGEPEKKVLYSLDYLACTDVKDISPDRVVKNYIEKYGFYDEKDYSRDMIIYRQDNYLITVRPITYPAAATATRPQQPPAPTAGTETESPLEQRPSPVSAEPMDADTLSAELRKPKVRPEPQGGIIISVYDDDVFKETYVLWRARLRAVEESIQQKF